MVLTYQDSGSYEGVINSILNYTINKEELIMMKDDFR